MAPGQVLLVPRPETFALFDGCPAEQPKMSQIESALSAFGWQSAVLCARVIGPCCAPVGR
jgi:hypothetical protein